MVRGWRGGHSAGTAPPPRLRTRAVRARPVAEDCGAQICTDNFLERVPLFRGSALMQLNLARNRLGPASRRRHAPRRCALAGALLRGPGRHAR